MVRGAVRHVALDLVERPKHADEGEDLQLAHRRCPLSFFCSSRPRRSRGTTGKTPSRPTRLATSTNWLRVVAEERGHRDTAVLALGVAEVADGLAVVDRPEQ